MRFVLTMILLSVVLLEAQECEDGVCSMEKRVDVLCPVGEERVQPVRQAARLDTLQGKTIALVGGSFMARVTHPELKRLILAKCRSLACIGGEATAKGGVHGSAAREARGCRGVR